MPSEELNLIPKEKTQVEKRPADLEVEKAVEINAEVREQTEPKKEDTREEARQDVQESRVPAAPQPQQPPSVPKKEPILVDLEDILADDLTDIFLGLPDDKKLPFKQKGEEVAVKIMEMVDRGKIRVRKVLELIREWLRMVPGVNKFFLEQEIKIKADKIMRYAKEHKNKQKNQL